MYYLKIIFLNIFRQKKYALSMFAVMTVVCMAVTVVLGIYTGSQTAIDRIADSYITTVRPIYYPMRSQTNETQRLNSGNMLTEAEISECRGAREVDFVSYKKSCPLSVYLWQFMYAPDSFAEDVVITDPDLMQKVYIDGVLNSAYCDTIELTAGEHITDETYDGQPIPILMSDHIAEKTGAVVGDVITISFADNAELPTNEFAVRGIFRSRTASEENLIYMPIELTEAYAASLGIDTAEASYLDYLFNMKFVLKHPDDAEAFISSAYEVFQENGYILQADDYEYKREVYPLKMMLRLNSIIGVGVIVLGVILLLIVTVQSIRVRQFEYTVYRLISMKRSLLTAICLLEKAVILFSACILGVFGGAAVVPVLFPECSFGFLAYALLVSSAFAVLILLVCFAIYTVRSTRSLMGEMSNGK